MLLHNNKYHIRLNKLNYLGYETEKVVELRIRDIKYMGEVKNEYMSFDVVGVPPSINKMMALSQSLLDTDKQTGDAMSSSVPEKDKNTYKHFVSFMVNNNSYLIPLDNENFSKSVIAESLMNHIIHGRQRDVLRYDFSELEAEGQRFEENFMEVLEMYDD